MQIVDFMFNIKFPREFALDGSRYAIVNSQAELNVLINKFISNHNLYTTVYSFKEVNGRIGNYSTAIIDRVYFDIDVKDRNNNEIDVILEAKKIMGLLDSKKLFYSVSFSGRGIHIIVYSKATNNKFAIKKFVNYVIDETKAKIDTSVVGDVAREIRIINTINQKSGLYCIPILPEELDSYEHIKSISTKPRKIESKFLIGEKLLDLNEYSDGEHMDFHNENYFDKIENGGDEIIDIEEFKKSISTIPCLMEIVNNSSAGYSERTLLISYMKSHGYSVEDAHNIIKGFISEEKWNKSKCTRTHAHKYYAGNYMLPSCRTIASQGNCPIYNKGLSQTNCKWFCKLNGW